MPAPRRPAPHIKDAVAPYPETALACSVAFAPEPRAKEAWPALLDRLGPRGVDTVLPATARLLPLVSNRLDALVIRYPDAERLRGTHRKLATENLLKWDRLRPLLAALLAADVQVALVGGLGRLRTVYPDVGTRVLDRADIAVPPSRLDAALAVVRAAGCVARFSVVTRPPVSDRHVFRVPAQGLGADFDLVVRSHLVPSSLAHGPDRWDRCRALDVDGLSLRQLAPEHALLQSAVDGVQRSDAEREERDADWLADLALTVMRTGIDWPLLAAEAKHYDVRLTLATALACAADIGIPIPPEVQPALALHSDLEADALAARLGGHPRDALWREYRHAVAPHANPIAAAAGFVRYAALRLGANGIARRLGVR